MSSIQLPGNSCSFLAHCINWYDAMQQDISLCRKKGLDKPKEIECCFEIATNYRGQLLKEVGDYTFESTTDEILFFKTIKPLFNAEVEYHTFCFHAELFNGSVEDSDPMELELFYRRQLQRFEKFIRERPVFYAYVKEGKIENDAEWFTRNEDIELTEQERRTGSTHDKLMGTYLALERYMNYISEVLKEIQKQC